MKNRPLRRPRSWSPALAWVLVFLSLAPFLYIFLRSFFPKEGFSLQAFYDVFLASPKYLLRFWKSLLLCACIALGQVVISVLAGYGFAKCRFRGRDALFFLLIVLMILPLQVTLVPNYIVLKALGLLNTYYALALPAIFVPLGTFIMTQSFRAVPREIIEAAELDGCTLPRILLQVAVPMAKSGLVCTLVLSFLDAWNMVEQPLAYLNGFPQYPLSVALASVSPSDPTAQLVCCILVALPPLFLFAFFSRDLVEGITLVKEK